MDTDDRIIIFTPQDLIRYGTKKTLEEAEKYNEKIKQILNGLKFKKRELKYIPGEHEFWVPDSEEPDGKITELSDGRHLFVINKYKEHKIFTGKGLLFVLEIKCEYPIDRISKKKEYEEFINKVRFAIEQDFIIINFGDGTFRTFDAKTKVEFLERDIREFIVKEIKKNYDNLPPEDILEEMVNRIDKEKIDEQRGAIVFLDMHADFLEKYIDSLNFIDLFKIIKRNWDIFEAHFKNYYSSKNKLNEPFRTINEIRNKIAHNRGEVTEDDIENLNKIYDNFNKIIFNQ
ncbi:hypothetical protein BEH94_09765 [Candidatus Altiarchaeales archaeon WOR_SM1_SCG]|nr:hypothetical protein BEH94_09765 [Candidatus Altiarchaeales archaeon WOR_SM1_SCG]